MYSGPTVSREDGFWRVTLKLWKNLSSWIWYLRHPTGKSLSRHNSRNPVIITIFKFMFRVIVLQMDAQTCVERLLNCRCNVITGGEHDLVSGESSVTNSNYKLDVYSKNYKDVEQEVTIVLFYEIFLLKIYIWISFYSMLENMYLKLQSFWRLNCVF